MKFRSLRKSIPSSALLAIISLASVGTGPIARAESPWSPTNPPAVEKPASDAPIPAAPAAPAPLLSSSQSAVPAAPTALTVSGAARFRIEGNDFTNYSNSRDFMTFRIRPDFNYKVDSQVDLLFEPQASKTLGEKAYNLTGTSGTGTPATAPSTSSSNSSGASYDTGVTIHQGYINYHPTEHFQLMLGRQILSYGDELVIGASDWGNIGRSFDVARVRLTFGKGKTDIFYSKILDTNITGNSVGDLNLYGLYNTWNIGSGLHAADLYVLHQQDSTLEAQTKLEAVGIRLKSDLAGLNYLGERFQNFLSRWDYRVEATQEFGNAVSNGDSAAQIDAEIGYTAAFTFKPRLGLEGALAGKNYNQLFPSTHKWLGYADVLGRRNITDYVVHASALATENLGIQLDYHKFLRTSASTAAFRKDGTPVGTAKGSSSKDLGHEWDLTLRYSLTRNLSLAGGGSLVTSGQYFTDQFNKSDPKFYYIMTELKF
ncbi:MAG: alginate export family protein [Methylotenera sp.]|nr:alginate export family protein [Oligoflexia bacterium]